MLEPLLMDTLRSTSSVPMRGVSSFQRLFCTRLYVAGTVDSVLIKEVSLFQKLSIERLHCAFVLALLKSLNVHTCKPQYYMWYMFQLLPLVSCKFHSETHKVLIMSDAI